jgi:signal transduction histidine kinase/CheY-like chemotaxis protein
MPRPVQSAPDPTLPRLLRWLRPGVDAVARLRLSVHRKLLIGFLSGALLLVGLAGLSLAVIERMNDRMEAFDVEAEKVGLAHELLYDVTAQSHYRAMALLRYDEGPTVADTWNTKVTERKQHFDEVFAELRGLDPENETFYDALEDANRDYATASARVVQAMEEGRWDQAEYLHVGEEHATSHVIEDMLSTCGQPGVHACRVEGAPLVTQSEDRMQAAAAAFHADHRLLQRTVLVFSAASLAVALVLGFLFSWAFLLPVWKVQRALAGLSAGELDQRVDVPNRDEFGRLSQDLNTTSERLATSFARQRSLARGLRESNASLARASAAKSRFLASVSHELRTPMNAILGFTDALLSGVDGPLNDEQRQSLGWVQRGGRDLLGLINEILDLSRIEAGRLVLSPERFDPRQVVSDVVEQHRPLVAQKEVTLHFRDAGAPPEVNLDRQRVRQILTNIVGNAVKFTERGRVEVEVGGQDEGLHVSVRDTAGGIDPALHEAIFEAFEQTGDNVAGTGLGLAISRRLARAMDGDVTVESEPGRGSTFHIRLPIDSRPAASEDAGRAPTAADAKRLVLSVDDDPSVAPLLQKMLGDHGYAVVPASSPRNAVAEAAVLRPDVILLDLLMEERAGEEILEELRAEPATREIPVVIISVVTPDEAPGLAAAHLRKPLDRSALLAALADLELDGVRQ